MVILPDCSAILPFIQPGWVGVEIGVSEGKSARAFLEHGVRFLYLIDPWCDYDGLLDKYLPGSYETAMQNLAPFSTRHATARMPSEEAAKYIPGGLDFVWVDGNHRYDWVKKDLELYWPKIRVGGLLCGHDYTDNADTCQVQSAVNQFADSRGLHVSPRAGSCWTIVKEHA